MTTDLKGDLRRVEDRWINDAIETKPSDVPDTVYHYTTAAGLFGMLSSKQLWLTDYRFLNDRTEFTHIYNILKDMRASLLGVGDLTDIQQKLLSHIEYDKEDSSDSFVFSLTSEKDDLSQWRGYANDGMGFTIGFSGLAIHELSAVKDAEFAFAKVDYDSANQAANLRRIFDEISQVAEKHSRSSAETDILAKAAFAFDRICLNRGALSKHDSFYSEKEWRMVSYSDSDSPRVRLSGDKLIPYTTINICAPDEPLPVTTIGIGPGFMSSEVVDAVKTLARQTGHSADIYFANTPYRRP